MKNKILFIINPKSGTGKYKRVPEKVAAYLDTDKYNYEICYTEYRGHASKLAAEAVSSHVYMVVVSGGDGTINEVVGALVGSETILGILATGSGNGLAHHMHLPFNLKKAIQVLNDEHCDLIDTVSINGRYYASIAGVGFDAFVAEKYMDVKHRGLFPYLRIAIGNYFPYKPRTYILTGDKEIKIKSLLISFANSSQWGFDVKISPQASVQDGLINVTTVQKPPVYALPRLLLFLITGNFNRMTKYVKIYKMRTFELKAEDGGDLCIHLDGDYWERHNDIQVQIHPNTLHIALKRTY